MNIRQIKKNYPGGCRIRLIEMKNDPHPVKPGTKGVVSHIDDIGTIHCIFDNGRVLGVIPGEDKFEKIDHREDTDIPKDKIVTITVGTLNMAEGRVDITDPCYNHDVTCRINDLHTKAGSYKCSYDYSTGARRVISASIEYCGDDMPKCTLSKRLYTTIGVDAGLAGFFIAPKPNYNKDEWHSLCNEIGNGNVYIDEKGFFTSSGYGDGEYPVMADYECNKDGTTGEIVGLTIIFINDDEDI